MSREKVLPKVAVVIPCYNEEKYIACCIKSIMDQDYPTELIRIVVVDNGSEDRSVLIANDFPVDVFVKDNVNVGAVRNYGASLVSAEIIAFIDSDCAAPKGWLNEAVGALLSDEQVAAVGGGCYVGDNASWIEAAWVPPLVNETDDSSALPGASFILKKKVFDDIGGFNENITAGEDDELSHRIREKGFRLVKTAGCYVEHMDYPSTLLGVLTRQIWHGRNQLQAAESLLDKMLIFTHLFIVSVILLFYSLLSFDDQGNLSAFFGGGGVLVFPFLAALHRVMGSESVNKYKLVSQLTIIFVFFFFGRAVGLLINYAGLLINYAGLMRSGAKK